MFFRNEFYHKQPSYEEKIGKKANYFSSMCVESAESIADISWKPGVNGLNRRGYKAIVKPAKG